MPYGFGKGDGLHDDCSIPILQYDETYKGIMHKLEKAYNDAIIERINSTRKLQDKVIASFKRYTPKTKPPTNSFLDNLTLFDCLVLRAREWRYVVEPIKYALMAEAMEKKYGRLYAITAVFAPDIEVKLRASKVAPSTFLKQRMHRSFGESIPRLGTFEYAGHGKKKSLHVHFLLPERDFSKWEPLRQKLIKVFGNNRLPSQFHQQTARHTESHGRDFFGFELTSSAGWMLYGLKGVIATQKRLKIAQKQATKKPLPLIMKRAQLAMSDCGKRVPISHYDLTGVAFHSADVAQLGKEAWFTLQSKTIMDYVPQTNQEYIEMPPLERIGLAVNDD